MEKKEEEEEEEEEEGSRANVALGKTPEKRTNAHARKGAPQRTFWYRLMSSAAAWIRLSSLFRGP